MIQLMTGQRARDYGEGVMDGMEIALELILGVEDRGGEPYRGERPEELRVYCEGALRRIKTERAAER